MIAYNVDHPVCN